MHAQMCRKDDIFRQRQLNHYDIGVGMGVGEGPLCITHFKEERRLMNEQKDKKNKNDDLR